MNIFLIVNIWNFAIGNGLESLGFPTSHMTVVKFSRVVTDEE